MAKLEYFLDRDEISSLPAELLIQMTKRGLIAPDQDLVHFCGFVSWKGGIAVFLPRNCLLKSRAPKYAFYLLQVLRRYYLGKSSSISEGQENDLIGKSSLSLVHNLIEDYCANGLYVQRRKYFSTNQGRANWKRTIANRTPYPSGDSIVYLDTDTHNTRYVSDCETARIHAHVMRHIDERYGVLFSGESAILDDRLERVLEPISNSEGQLAILDRELSASYSERDIRLIGMLKAYIQEISATEGHELLVGTRKFHNVWEGMLDNCIPRKIEINSKLPVPYYQQGEYFYEVSKKGQRTDTVVESEDGSRWAVIDAKYYNAFIPSLAPGWHDLVKQFFYKTAAEEVCGPDTSVTLHFVFPGTKQHLLKVKVGARGQKTIRADVFEEVAGYGEIHCHYCNPIILIEKYALRQLLDLNNETHITGAALL
jgi:hypothetical protein